MKGLTVLVALVCVALSVQVARAAPRQHNIVLFVADGLRAGSVTPQDAPAMARLRDAGVNFANPHSLFPTFTTANASAFATGHYLGDTGNYGNTIYAARPIAAARGSVTPFLENDVALGELDENFGGNYLNEETILKAARAQGFSTAAMGKLGPALIFDHTERSGEHTIIFDDRTGTPSGIPLSQPVKDALSAAGLPLQTPERGDNGKRGDFRTPGTKVANIEQIKYFTDVATKVVLPMFKARNKPFVLVFWSRDPDGTMHNQGDSLLTLTPGINGPTSKAAVRNADDTLNRLRQALDELGLAATTNILVAADHGFSTISKESNTSPAARASYDDTPPGLLPSGFLAIDLGKALGLPLFEPGDGHKRIGDNAHPRSDGLLGHDPNKPDVVVATNGGSDLIYLPNGNRKLARRVVDALLAQDYTSGIFVDDAFGLIAGTLPLSRINLKGKAVTPQPAIVINFRSQATGCADWTMCTVSVVDAFFQQGQGMHGNFNRGDTRNFMAAIGPDFKAGFVDRAPASNADFGRTIARLLHLKIARKGSLVGRVLYEAMPGGITPKARRHVLHSRPSKGGLRTVLHYETVGRTRYFDMAGFPGRTAGMDQGVPFKR